MQITIMHACKSGELHSIIAKDCQTSIPSNLHPTSHFITCRPDNMAGAVSLYANLIKAIEAPGTASIRGLATDIANYTPLKEPYLAPSNQTVLSSEFYQCAPRTYLLQRAPLIL